MSNIVSHRLFRIYDWWEYKIPQILVPIYLLVLNSDYIINNKNNFEIFFKLLIGLVLGALTVSIMGEYYDIKQDKIANKKNGFKNLSYEKSVLVIFILIFINILYLLFVKTEPKIFYLLSILIFFFYYIPLFRLKEKGILGVIADSLGSHVFPSCFVFLFLIPVNTILKLEYGIFFFWIFLFGVRGIINHQYTDLENDKKSNTNTFVRTSSRLTKKTLQKTLFSFELILFSTLITLTVNYYLIVLGILIYLLILFGRKMLFNNAIVYFNIKKDQAYTLFLFEFYTIFFPLLLIIQIYVVNKPFFWGALLLHIFITYKKITTILKELKESINFILQ